MLVWTHDQAYRAGWAACALEGFDALGPNGGGLRAVEDLVVPWSPPRARRYGSSVRSGVLMLGAASRVVTLSSEWYAVAISGSETNSLKL